MHSKSTTSLDQIYSSNDFRQVGHQLVDLLADQLEKSQSDPKARVIDYRSPEEELAFWQNNLQVTEKPIALFQQIIEHAIQVHHPRYMGHQVSVPALMGSLAGLISEVMSNGTGVYEMGMSSNAIEKVVTDFVAQKIGYATDAAGFLTSGGTLANLTALLAARKAKAPSAVWENGHAEQLAVLVSEEAHYCIDRAARVLGMGEQGIIKVPVNEQFQIRSEVLEEYLNKAKEKGLHVIAVIGCASSTATGSYDDLNALADFCERHQLWLHIDGAHGGAVVFSEKYRHLTDGIERADSVVIDFHKMLLTPALNTALIFKNGALSYQTFQQQAQYLWDVPQIEEWYHSGKRTFECTKLMLSIKFYTILKTYGEKVFAENVDRLYDLARNLATMIQKHPQLELVVEPAANIVNFRFMDADPEQLDRLNALIRQRLVEKGAFYIVQTVIRQKRYLRTTLMNPLTTIEDLEALLQTITKLGLSLKQEL